MSDTVSRFSAKAEIYSQYRWDYAPQAIEAIFGLSDISHEAVVADIGAGTGMLSRHFVDRVQRVLAIEPNPDMRAAAVKLLGRHSNFGSLDGYAHATTLPDHAVDLIVVGRAVHWFEPLPTRAEWLRILKPGGWLAILQVPCTSESLLAAIKSIRTRANGWDVGGDKSQRTVVPLSFYFGSDDFTILRFPATVEETWPDFLGRLTSISSAPDAQHPHYPRYRRGARRIFDRFSVGGRLSVPIATELSLGRLRWPS